MNYLHKEERNRGISSIAIVLIAAVAIGGGAVLLTGNNDTDEQEEENTSTSTQQVTIDENMSTFRCEDGGMITADTSIDGQVEVTLPSGEAEVLTETEGAEGALYTSADGSVTFLNQEGEAVVEQDGEVTFEGCSIVSSDSTEADVESTSTTSLDVDADTEVSSEVRNTVNLDSEASNEATTTMDAAAGSDAGVEVNAETETEAQY